MAGMCCGVVGETETAATVGPIARASRRRRLDLRSFKLVADADAGRKRQRLDLFPLPSSKITIASAPVAAPPRDGSNAVENCKVDGDRDGAEETKKKELSSGEVAPKFGMTSVCGRRRDMEDAVSIHTSFTTGNSSFFGVFDGHGCSHVAMKCKERFHEIVKNEMKRNLGEKDSVMWKETMERSFVRMDKEVGECSEVDGKRWNCRCELQTPQCDAVGSTAVVAVVTRDKIIVSNCGDSRAVLSRNSVAIPLSSDHKPDRPDELTRIESAGGRVIYWDGPRVLGVLAMSRAIGDNYLKPYVIPDPEVTVIDRTEEDECLILASDGLWDVVSNDTACGVARMCLRAEKPPSPPQSPGSESAVGSGALESSDKACSDASILLTKLALARRSQDNVSVVVVDLRKGSPMTIWDNK